ncbi:MAG: amidohydrolase [Planctomycetes bacterium]|nr:amidohydrolase [Planctomycetota bacterium]
MTKMIVDCHTQFMDALAVGAAAPLPAAVQAQAARHFEAVNPVDRAIVLGFKSCYLRSEIPNRYVSEYVRRYSTKLIGFAGIDPTEPDWRAELTAAHEELGLKGVTVSPALQDFHPTDSRAMRFYGECARRHMPVLFQQNVRFAGAKMEFARPLLLDEVAREFPDLRLVVAHLGYPWVDETLVLLAKHANVFADIAGLLRQPWMSYNALLSASGFGVMEKLLFGSDFPYRSPAACIETLYSLNQLSQGTSLLSIPREQLRGIVERDALALLGIDSPMTSAQRAASPRMLGEYE